MSNEFFRHVYECETASVPMTLRFTDATGKELGFFDFSKSPMTFTGDVDEAGKMFVDHVRGHFLKKDKLEEKQSITIETLTKHLRSAMDSARDHQKNAVRKEVELCEAKNLLGRLITNIGSVDYHTALQEAKKYLSK